MFTSSPTMTFMGLSLPNAEDDEGRGWWCRCLWESCGWDLHATQHPGRPVPEQEEANKHKLNHRRIKKKACLYIWDTFFLTSSTIFSRRGCLLSSVARPSAVGGEIHALAFLLRLPIEAAWMEDGSRSQMDSKHYLKDNAILSLQYSWDVQRTNSLKRTDPRMPPMLWPSEECESCLERSLLREGSLGGLSYFRIGA